MASVYNVEIKESAEELKELLRGQTQAKKRDRLRALYLKRTGQVQSRRQLAEMLGCAESTIYRWFKKYQKQGLEGLLSVKTSPGRPAKISGAALRDLKKQLRTRTGFGSYEEIQEWLAKEHQLETPYSTVHATVRYRLKAKLKVSRPRSSEANPQVQDKFKKAEATQPSSHGKSSALRGFPALQQLANPKGGWNAPQANCQPSSR